MKRRLVLASAVLVALGGCTSSPSAAGSFDTKTPASAKPSPSGPDAQQELIAALKKTHANSYKFSLKADLPDKAKVQASGAFDPRQKRFSLTEKESGNGGLGNGQSIVVGTDYFNRQKTSEQWVHLDLKRVKPSSSFADVNTKDPNGLGKFITTVHSVQPDGQHKYRGTFDPAPTGDGEPFAPIGAPSVIAFSVGTESIFTATTNDGGWVTSISLEMYDEKTKLVMTTTLSNHGKSTGVAKPSSYDEADDFYYK
ncbi:hypothetical protein HH310_21445 [Actinoplanes sp. TBRC 11911]|uniref:hypothetical protein n=1 Tax=Actinoplanes sp. TBRC 11911 TaxID=2729386 RepID=UPI00145F9F7F|nr:hypothetical protein [Actinoplanes sp. TBRC 11911]NMO53738.1 hypothetical protein [Actinoplanes sp. TBRC 11911]